MKTTFVLLFVCAYGAVAQSNRENYFAAVWENDAMSVHGLTDRNYTNGIRLERMGPRYNYSHFLLNNLLIRNKSSAPVVNLYGAFLGQNMYTPENIASPDVQLNDRPFSGWLYYGVKCMSTNPVKKNRITSELHLGVIGPYAFAGETQTFIHKVSSSTLPQGWSHQIDSDLGINYVFRYEAMIVAKRSDENNKTRNTKNRNMSFARKYFECLWTGEVNAGTVFNNVGLGGMIRAGFLIPYFGSYNFGSPVIIKLTQSEKMQFLAEKNAADSASATERKFGSSFIKGLEKAIPQFFVYARPQVRAVLYNAMVQGGVFNKTSEHTMNHKDVNNFFGQLDVGAGITIRSMTITYAQSIRTKELSLNNYNNHYWGTICFIFNY